MSFNTIFTSQPGETFKTLTALDLESGGYTVQPSDNGKILLITSFDPVAFMVIDAGMPEGFSCSVISRGPDPFDIFSFTASLIKKNGTGNIQMSGNNSMIKIFRLDGNLYLVTGDLV